MKIYTPVSKYNNVHNTVDVPLLERKGLSL